MTVAPVGRFQLAVWLEDGPDGGGIGSVAWTDDTFVKYGVDDLLHWFVWDDRNLVLPDECRRSICVHWNTHCVEISESTV